MLSTADSKTIIYYKSILSTTDNKTMNLSQINAISTVDSKTMTLACLVQIDAIYTADNKTNLSDAIYCRYSKR